MQDQQRINMAERKLTAELALFPLQQTVLQQQQEIQAANIKQKLDELEIAKQANAAMAELSGVMSQHIGEGSPEQIQWQFAKFGIEHPSVLNDPRYKQWGKQIEEMRAQADLARYRAEVAQAALDRADAMQDRTGLGAQKLELDKEREARLQRQFEQKVKDTETRVPQDRLELFRRKAKAIQDDLSLLTKPEEKQRQLDALAAEMGIGQAKSTIGTPTNSGGFKVKVIKP